MKVYHYLTFLVLFGSFFWTGLWAGRKIESPLEGQSSETLTQPQTMSGYLNLPEEAWSQAAPPSPAALPPGRPTPTPILTPDEPEISAHQGIRQRNILVIGVDNLESPEPRLESLWMALYLTQTPALTLMPLYPSVPTEDGQPPQEDALLAADFHLTQEGAPVPSFFATLQEWDMWWSGYILLDESALIQIVGWLSQANQDLWVEDSQLLTDLPRPWVDFNAAYKGQTWLVRRLCEDVPWLEQNSAMVLSKITALIPSHLRTDLDVSQIAEEWCGMLAHKGGFKCELPFLLLNP